GLAARAVALWIVFVIWLASGWHGPSGAVRDWGLWLSGGLVFAAAVVAALWKLPRRLVAPWRGSLKANELAEAESTAPATLAQIVAGLAAFVGIWFTWRQLADTRTATQGTLQLTREGQVTESYTRAIDQLGSARYEMQLAAVYALDRIARESPEHYYWPVM